jgi:outer membrane protein OmpA-like peptidoglycan-associated protein
MIVSHPRAAGAVSPQLSNLEIPMPFATLLILAALDAQAQDGAAASGPAVPDLNAQLYRVPIDAERTLWADDTNTGPMGYWRAKAGLVYAHDPLVYRDEDGVETAILEDALQADLIGMVNISRLRIGLDLPLWLMNDGALGEGGAGLGDVALDLKGTIIVRDDDNPFGLALGSRFDLPTATVDAPVGHPGLAWNAQVIADLEVGDVLLAANLGTQGVPPAQIDGQTWDDQFFYRFGAGWSIAEKDRAGLSFDMAGRAAYGGLGASGSPVEGLLGGWFTLGESWVVRAGAGRGITSGIGTPDIRTVLTVGYKPPKVRDRDEDGILDSDDACKMQPEDFDGWKDSDGCPDPTTAVTVRLVDGEGEPLPKASIQVQTHDQPAKGGQDLKVDLHPGSWSVTVNAPRFRERTLEITVPEGEDHLEIVSMAPTFGRVRVIVTDTEGNPLDASVRVRGTDKVEDAPGGKTAFEIDEGARKLVVQAEGFKPAVVDIDIKGGKAALAEVQLESSRAKVTKEKIEILDKVYFDTGKATIKPESFQILGDVAALIDANPDVRKVRIEGHTDKRGDDAENLSLSQARADSVKAWLVEHDIAADRLEAVGYGETQPVDTGSSRAAYDKNRRVAFTILERDE